MTHLALKAHNEGRGALWPACQPPAVLVYEDSHFSEAAAITRERQTLDAPRSWR